MTKVKSTQLPASSSLHSRVGAADFLDCYAVASRRPLRAAAEILLNFPGWVTALMRLRNMIVAPFGLSTDGPAVANKIGLFPIESETEHELIAGFNDKHLDFCIAVLAEDANIFLATWVRPHNLGGRMYLTLILPFHILIVRNALRRLADND